MNLTDRVAIVTGAARGIGLAIAERLCRAGAHVVLTDLRSEDLDAAVSSVMAQQPSAVCVGLVADVTKRPSVDAMVAAVLSRFGRVDILVNNAGIWKDFERGPFWSVSSEDWQLAFQVNAEGAFNCASAVAAPMMSQKCGRIIFIGSTAPGEALADFTHYAASKAALTGLMRCVAKELGKDGVTVNMVHPGQTDTGAIPRERLEMKARTKFIPRVGVPDDLTGIVAFLASDESSFITGQQIYVDGGAVLN
ncbi:SDR family NAD(P)-dependent oxidoreductase [Lichenifustis flavocetrariae]|uniref:SDR family oxidoreductase n=1 Tax=Lichenifustis flavocetrariae TaxID=2949735 RepID=A0AA41YVR7_9HYPH|nr:SDR family oxidoreductase [Lichenifustis flavocetrariae]MCW6507843.1 SDR family oxidoreductase [Lichenifustis flavocetrariae]